ncbi:MAG: histidine-type phosphatase [Bilophila wadsworthia]
MSRHGVRSPTQSSETLESWSRKDWPEWPVKRGELTPRGAKLVTAMWEQEAAFLREAGLLPSKGCPEAGTIAVRADRDQRTRVTERPCSRAGSGVRVQAYRERDGPSRSAVPSVGGRILRARSRRCSQGNSRRRD